MTTPILATPKKCSFEGCQNIASRQQAEKTIKLLGKPYCHQHAPQASAETADMYIPQEVEIKRLLEKRGFEEQEKKGVFVLDQVVVDLNNISKIFSGLPQVGVLQTSGEIIEEGHGIMRIDDLRQEIEGVMKSKSANNRKKETPAPVAKSEEKKEVPPVETKSTEPEVKLVPVERVVEVTKITTKPQTCGFLKPAATIEDALAAFEMFERAKTTLLKDSDVLWIGANGRPSPKGTGHPHIKRSGWRKLARFFGINCSILNKEKIISQDSEGQYYIWKYQVRAEHPTGGYFEADGICTSRDPFFSKKNGVRVTPEEADIMMKAQTVAFNRVVSDLLGSGEVSADEIKDRGEDNV
jgi:hypothetical protein